jgi:hypothetical protein
VDSFDDAIRQHLDLKRKRGADPREVAELQREALGPDPSTSASVGVDDTQIPVRSGRSYADVVDWSDGHRLQARRTTLDQQTVEIDIREIIDAGGRDELAAARKAYDWSADLAVADIADPASEFEWESPHRSRMRGAA